MGSIPMPPQYIWFYGMPVGCNGWRAIKSNKNSTYKIETLIKCRVVKFGILKRLISIKCFKEKLSKLSNIELRFSVNWGCSSVKIGGFFIYFAQLKYFS